MGYKLLGFVVWKGAKWYLGRRVGSSGRTKGALVAGALAVAAGAVVVLGRAVAKD
jgi:hypothetical protein